MAENNTKTEPEAKNAAPPGAPAAKDDAKAPAEKSARPGASPLMAAALLVGMVIGSASAALVVASLLLRNAPAQSEAAKAAPEGKAGAADKKDQKPCEYTTDSPLIVNVYQTQERRYLSVKPVFVLSGSEALGKIKANDAELQHILIGILKGQTLDQLDDPDAGNTLSREIQETANAKLNLDDGITRVYFTQFVVQ